MKAIPGNPPAYDAFYSKVWDIAIAGETAQDFSALSWPELEESFKEELSALFAGKASAAETAAAIQKRWEAILESR
jgi:ABC-type glycerol-3-phosphate transport system substrate-binding protein